MFFFFKDNFFFVHISLLSMVTFQFLALFPVDHRSVGKGATPFPGLLHFTLDTYLILLSIKQGGIKYHFKSIWYDVTWD